MDSDTQTPTLDLLARQVGADPGLRAATPASDISGGVAAARLMNEVLAQAIAATGVNTDRLLSAADMQSLSDHIRANATLYQTFIDGHGDDEGDTETGFHLVQGDGGTLKFQGRAFIDTVADAIYHFGFPINDGRFENEDGNANELAVDVAGWLNYYVNGVNVVYGSARSETLYSGDYSSALAAAANETFLAGNGHDNVWAGEGHDEVHAGAGNDTSGGGAGDDTLLGEAGNDKLWGGDGADLLIGGVGADEMGGGTGDDIQIGQDGTDSLWGDSGDDVLLGGAGADKMHGGTGADLMTGDDGADEMGLGSGNDTALGGSGHDILWGEAGADVILGQQGNDTIGAGTGGDVVLAGEGNDSVWADAGDDEVFGEAGDDTLGGSEGADLLMGGAGRDMLTGGEGRDTMVGGAGQDELLDWEDREAADLFVFLQGDTGTGAAADVIKGFTSGTDRIDLTDFNGLSFIGTAAFGSGPALRVANDLVQIDADGDGATDAEIKVFWVGLLEAGDFVL